MSVSTTYTRSDLTSAIENLTLTESLFAENYEHFFNSIDSKQT
jgi:hypothetical protein